LVLAIIVLSWPTTSAWAQCSGAYLVEVNRALEMEREKTDRFRATNKADFKKLLGARQQSGRYDKAANEQFGQDLMRRIRDIHQGMPKQNAAVQALRQILPAAVERNDCAAAQQAAEGWLQMARARIDEYDRYFSYVDSLSEPEGGARAK
jgi:hypothetical protein